MEASGAMPSSGRDRNGALTCLLRSGWHASSGSSRLRGLAGVSTLQLYQIMSGVRITIGGIYTEKPTSTRIAYPASERTVLRT